MPVNSERATPMKGVNSNSEPAPTGGHLLFPHLPIESCSTHTKTTTHVCFRHSHVDHFARLLIAGLVHRRRPSLIRAAFVRPLELRNATQHTKHQRGHRVTLGRIGL